MKMVFKTTANIDLQTSERIVLQKKGHFFNFAKWIGE